MSIRDAHDDSRFLEILLNTCTDAGNDRENVVFDISRLQRSDALKRCLSGNLNQRCFKKLTLRVQEAPPADGFHSHGHGFASTATNPCVELHIQNSGSMKICAQALSTYAIDFLPLLGRSLRRLGLPHFLITNEAMDVLSN